MVKPKPPSDKFWSRPKISKVERNYSSPTGYSLQYTYKDGPDRGKMTIPTDKKGNIPDNVLYARFVDTEKGAGPNRKSRSIVVDITNDAREFPKKSPQQYEWYRRPNKYDISKVDTPDSELIKNSKKVKGIVVIGDAKKSRKIVQHIDDNFSNAEKRKMQGLIIEVGRGDSAAKGAAGYYSAPGKGSRRTKTDKATRDIAYIKVGKKYVDSPKTITHEVVHHLRHTDESRKFPFKAPRKYIGKDADYEEALTEAETISRQKTYKHKDYPSGYWAYIREQNYGKSSDAYGFSQTLDRYKFTNEKDQEQYDKLKAEITSEQRVKYVKFAKKSKKDRTKEEQAYVEEYEARLEKLNDKKLALIKRVTETKGVKGKKALNRVKKHFETSRIATLREANKGRAEAIDTYMTYKTNDGQIRNAHFYSPNANIDEKAAAREALNTDNVIVWRDGKKGKPMSAEAYTKMSKKPTSNIKSTQGKGKGWHGERIRHRNAAMKGRGMK
tara:strand:+ start:71 stop:1561 length:1491 start_codon:yes stop_codon:yes gene_type:complete